MVMIRLNIHEAKTHLSRYLERLQQEGEVIVICKRNVPIAEIRPLPKRPPGKRPIGLLKGQIHIPPSFYEPLPDDLLDLFEGKGEEPPSEETPSEEAPGT